MFVQYKEGEKHAGKNAEISESMDTFDDCGLMLSSEDIVVDIDHLPKESIKAMLEIFDIKTRTVWTERGVHLWFKRPSWLQRRRDGICRLGFEIEQHNKTSKPNGMTVKRNGVARQIDYFDKQIYMPAIFKVDTRDKYNNLTGMEEGNGRNKALFEHRMKLRRNASPDVEKICSFINKYVFADPLSDTELEGILRDIPLDEDSSGPAAVATVIMDKCMTKLYSGGIWWYRDAGGCKRFMKDDNNNALKRVIAGMVEGERTSYIDEVIRQIEYRCEVIPGDEVFPIRFKNGVLKNGEFTKIKDYEGFTPYYIDIEYKPDAEPVKAVDDYIDNLTNGDPDYKKLLAEVIGYVLIVDPEKIRSLGKFFMFRGDGANGKGTLLQIMQQIYNKENCTNLSIKQLTDDRYKVTMVGKLANLGDDIEPEAIDNDQLKVLKNISTADTVATRHLYSESESVTFTTKLYFTTNSDIRSFEKGYAYKRRIVWLPMFNKVEKPDPNFITKMTTPEALEYWIRLIVEGYKRLYVNSVWTECKAVSDYNEQYHENNNVCYMFAKDLDPDEIIGKTVREMQDSFNQWDTGDMRFSSKLFKEAVWDLYKIGLGRAKVDGRTRRTFIAQKDTSQKLEH